MSESTASKAAVAGGVGGVGLLVWLVDRLLVDGGEQAATTLGKLSPVLGPVWASWPVLLLVVVVAVLAFDRWRLVQEQRAEQAQAQATAAAELTGKVGEVATGLLGLRTEVHELRSSLHQHADQTDEKLRGHDAGLQLVRAEVSEVKLRVDELEHPRPRPRRR